MDTDIRLSSLPGSCLSFLYHNPAPFVCTSLFTALLTYTIYNLVLHPLSAYPGPLLGRLTPFYDIYHAYAGDKHVVLYHLHNKHGRIVRFTPNTLSINDPAALKAIYSHGANVQKSEFYRCFRARPDAISTLLATEKSQHARKRRVMGQAFADQAVKGLEIYVLAHVQDLVERIGKAVGPSGGRKEAWSQTLDMQKWSNWLVFDIMGDLVFGKSFDTLGERPENRNAIYLLTRAARRNYTVAAWPKLLHWNLESWLPVLRGLYLDRNQYLAFGKQQALEAIERNKKQEESLGGTDRKDIFTFLFKAKDPETGEGFPMPEMWMEANTLIVAGSDTSSTTLAATLFYLLRNPITLTRLEHEIRSTFSCAEEIRTGPELQSCAWLRACIDEAMRMTPAVPGVLPREVLSGGLSIPSLDLHLPEGVNVGVPIYSIHHHAGYVTNPFTYDPSRWMSDWHVQDKEALKAVFNPFSQGHRACLGKPLVYMEISIAIARLVWEFDMKLSRDQQVGKDISKDVESGKRHAREYHVEDWFLTNNYGPFVEFRAREVEDKVDSAVDGWSD